MNIINHNALLEFPVFTSSVVRDKYSGNWKPEKTTPLIVKAQLQITERTPTIDERVGMNRTQVLLEGYLVDPKHIKYQISSAEIVKCTLLNNASDINDLDNITGEFLMRSYYVSPWSIVTRISGAKIIGFFRYAGGAIN